MSKPRPKEGVQTGTDACVTSAFAGHRFEKHERRTDGGTVSPTAGLDQRLRGAAEADDEFIRGWEAARDYLEAQPGYVNTALHRAVSPDADFRFVNVGRWGDPQAFQAAVQNAGFREASEGLARFRPTRRSMRSSGRDFHSGRSGRRVRRSRQVSTRSGAYLSGYNRKAGRAARACPPIEVIAR